MARDAGVVCLLIMIAHLCSCARYSNYSEYLLESEKICHFLTKKHTLDLRLGTAAVVIPRHMFDHWQSITADFPRFCRFVFKTSKGEGLFAVIQKMAFRRDGDQCIDYVRFKRSDGHYTAKFCGEIDRSLTMYLPVPESDNSNDSRSSNYNMYAEFDPIKRSKPWYTAEPATIETEIFISKESVLNGQQALDLFLVYTPYKSCSQADSEQYQPVGHNNCIRKEYVCDKIYNCPFGVCSDEVNCVVNDRYPKNDTTMKITVEGVIITILCFIVFIMCLSWMAGFLAGCGRGAGIQSRGADGPDVGSRGVLACGRQGSATQLRHIVS